MKNSDKISEFFGFPVDVRHVFRHLRQDMRDDWYYDALQYEDYFRSHTDCIDIIERCVSEGHGIYGANPPTVRGIPKKGYTERYALETDFFDRFVYQAVATFLIPLIDPLLSNRVLSYRNDPHPIKPKYLFKNKIERWSTFEGITYTFRADKRFLAVTDLTNFFDGISSEKVCEKLTSFVPKIQASAETKAYVHNAISLLRRNLAVWSFQSGIGLPQNRDASSFLANVALYDVDNSMRDMGYDYYRYVDDIRILCDTDAEARTALQQLVREARKYGFSLNSAKTIVLSHEAPSDVVSSVFTSRDTNIVAINNMWKSRSSRVVSRSVKYLYDIISSCIDEGDTQSRSFRFAVNRISYLVRVGLVSHDDRIIHDLKEALCSSLYDNAVSTDQYCRIIIAIDPKGGICGKIAEYLTDDTKAIYDWQNYNLWMLLARHKFTEPSLEEKALSIVHQHPHSGEAAGVFVWARSTENLGVIETALDAYLSALDQDNAASWPFLNQRYLLIIAGSLDETQQKKLWNRPPTKLRMTTTRCAPIIPANGIPIIDPKPPQISMIIEEANDYI